MNTVSQDVNKIVWYVILLLGVILVFFAVVGDLLMALAFCVCEPRLYKGIVAGLIVYNILFIAGVALLRVKPISLPQGKDWGFFLLRLGSRIVGWYIAFLGGSLAVGGLLALPNIAATLMGGVCGAGLIWVGLWIAHKGVQTWTR